MRMNEDPNTVIDALGGTSKVAELCELTTGAVSQWRNNGIPKMAAKYLRELRPDVFDAAAGYVKQIKEAA